MAPSIKTAIIHEWLASYSGSERVLEQMIACYPDSDIFCVINVLSPEEQFFLQGKRPRTTFIQKLPFAKRLYRSYLPLMPLAVEQIDLSAYELVLSSSHAVAKGVITGPDQLHICMCHSPMRYAWDLQAQYLAESGLTRGVRSWVARWLLHRLRIWDIRAAMGVDVFIANSSFIARRIRHTYRRSASVIYPPVDLSGFSIREDKEDFYLTASRLVPYKRVDLIVDAFAAMPHRKLVVIGDGPRMRDLKARATSNITIMGQQSFQVLRDYMQRARAFVFAAEEDFGIVPVEAQACGTPVIAFGKGGALETIIGVAGPERTGLFFQSQTVQGITSAIEEFEALDTPISPRACRENATRFSIERFRTEYTNLVEQAVRKHRETIVSPME